ncbi:acyl-CoA dehydrogenase family protein [Legionella sp. W05-934-2]|uniref:acyl-CoA dehydrogenase family protein n=1 Tax=Legionella sp. W05-934-2 TaxID=1198649 RepID=UPI00346241E2
MDFNLSEEHLAFRDMAANFAEEKLRPNAGQWDLNHTFPINVLKEAAQLGMAAMVCREDIGGAGLTRLDAAIIFEQLATGCITTTAYLSIHNMVASLIDRYSDDAFRKHWGPQLTSMSKVASYCLTEPESGSDAASLKTNAEDKGDHYLVNGCKTFISGGSVSDLYLTMVRTGDNSYRGISSLLIEKNMPGVSFGAQEMKMGWKAQPTTMVYFENVKVPKSHLVGKEGEGFRIALNALNGGRINIAACSLGGALACLRACQRYMLERKQFEKPIAQFQGLRFYFSDMYTQFESARLMVYRAASALHQEGPKAATYCAMAKRYATDTAFQIADRAMQIHGGYGYLHDYQIERIFRDLRVHCILEGTNEIMREIIAKNTLTEDYVIE